MEMRTPMEFYKIDDYVVANTPVQSHFVERDGRSVIFSLIFLNDLGKAPEFSLATMSGRAIVEKGVPVKSALADNDRGNRNDSTLGNKGIKKFESVRIAMTFASKHVDMCFRMKESLVNGADRFNCPLEMASSLFLVIRNEEFAASTRKYLFAILLQRDFIAFSSALKTGQKILICDGSETPEERASSFLVRPSPLINSSSASTPELAEAGVSEKKWRPPLCFLCMEKEVEVVTMNCNHVMFCFDCYIIYVKRERERIAAIFPPSKRAEEDGFVRCALCRRRIEGVGRVWFKSPKCLLCGCSTIDAVAGGHGGCGCAFGCYKESTKLLRKCNPRCPYCGSKIVDLIRIFVQGEGSNQ